MLSQVFVLSPRGDTIIFKDFKGNVPKARLLCLGGSLPPLDGHWQQSRQPTAICCAVLMP
jgi:hypothetical protein